MRMVHKVEGNVGLFRTRLPTYLPALTVDRDLPDLVRPCLVPLGISVQRRPYRVAYYWPMMFGAALVMALSCLRAVLILTELQPLAGFDQETKCLF